MSDFVLIKIQVIKHGYVFVHNKSTGTRVITNVSIKPIMA